MKNIKLISKNAKKLLFKLGCSGALFVYDKTRHSTYQSIASKWLEDFIKFGKPDGVYLLIGNKLDLQDSIKVSSEEGKELSQEINATEFIETSAKYGENVEMAFKKLVLHILNKRGAQLNLS